MKTYKSQQVWISEIKIGQVTCICEANKRAEARRGAVEMAKRRVAK